MAATFDPLRPPDPPHHHAASPSLRPTFAAMLSNSRNASSILGQPALEDFPVSVKFTTVDGIPSITFASQDLARAAAAFKHALVMKFSFSKRPSVELVRAEINGRWGLKFGATISILDARHLLLKCHQEDDLIKALSRESTRVCGTLYKIFRWSPDFDPKHDASIASVWIQLKDLPPHMFFPSFLRNIVKPIGNYLRADNSTITMSNTTRARICVEVDLRKKLPEKINVNVSRTRTRLQYVMYEEVPKFCEYCMLQGHNHLDCTKKKGAIEKVIPADQVFEETSNPKGSLENNPNSTIGGGRGIEIDACQLFDDIPDKEQQLMEADKGKDDIGNVDSCLGFDKAENDGFAVVHGRKKKMGEDQPLSSPPLEHNVNHFRLLDSLEKENVEVEFQAPDEGEMEEGEIKDDEVNVVEERDQDHDHIGDFEVACDNGQQANGNSENNVEKENEEVDDEVGQASLVENIESTVVIPTSNSSADEGTVNLADNEDGKAITKLSREDMVSKPPVEAISESAPTDANKIISKAHLEAELIRARWEAREPILEVTASQKKVTKKVGKGKTKKAQSTQNIENLEQEENEESQLRRSARQLIAREENEPLINLMSKNKL